MTVISVVIDKPCLVTQSSPYLGADCIIHPSNVEINIGP